VPARSFVNPGEFLERGRYVLDRFERAGERGENVLCTEERQATLHALNRATYKLEPPLQKMEHGLHPWVVFAIMPLFALANAGVPLGGDLVETLTSPVSLGIAAGLVVGKQLGVTFFAWLAVRSGVSELPEGIAWRHIYGAGWLAGIGFTMSIFISDLACAGSGLLEAAKLGILAASLLAGVVGWTILRGAASARATRSR
jgi:Na+:H+ antiporter, NhaA family